MPSANLRKAARVNLAMLHADTALEDSRVPPGNPLEALVGDRRGQRSIRINDQTRVCFVRQDGDAYQVEITDYHSSGEKREFQK